MTGERDGPPYVISGGLGDTVTSLTGVIAILAALQGRERTGRGQFIGISMVESLAYADCTILPSVAANGVSSFFRNGQQSSYSMPMGPVKVADGYISIHALGAGPGSPWGRLCSLMGREDLLTDPTLKTDNDRRDQVEVVLGAIESWLAEVDRETAILMLSTERIACGPVLSQEEMMEHRFFRQRGTFGKVTYPGLGEIGVVEPPFKFSGADAYVRGPAPEMGSGTWEVLTKDLGLTPEEISELADGDVVYAPTR
jgi:CoA:oxalate CoA-transferase